MDLTTFLTAFGLSPERAALVALAVMGASSLLAAALPQPAAGSPWTGARRILDVLAGNLGHAANRTMADRLAVAMTKPGASWPDAAAELAPEMLPTVLGAAGGKQ